MQQQQTHDLLGAMASTPDSSTAPALTTQARDPALASVAAKAPAFRVNPRKLDPLDEESDSDEDSSDDDSDSSSGEEGIEVISADDSSNDEGGGAGDGSHRSQADRLRALQTASSAASPASAGSATPVPAAATSSARAVSPEKAAATSTAATHSSPSNNKDRDETTSGGGSAAREGGVAAGVMDQCCIERCTKPHSNHVYNEAVGRMRDLPNSQRMCRAHYIEGLGQCCVKDCKNKATNRNLKKGASLPIKEGLPEHMLHKVCMEHWNLVDQQTRGGETRKRSRRKKKDDPSAGGAKSGGRGRKRRRNSSGDAEVEAFLASELGGKLSGESDSGEYSDDSDQEQHETRRLGSAGPNEFYAVKSEGQARGEKRERLVSTLSEEDASSDDELDHQDAKRRRSMTAARDDTNGAAPFGGKSPFSRAMKGKAGGLAGRTGGGVQHGADRVETTAGGDSHKAKETSTTKSAGLDATAGADLKADVQQLRGEVAQLRSELKDLGRTMKEAMMSQLNSLKTECLALIGAKLTEAHEREMIQLRLLAAGRQRPPGAAQQAASSSSSSPSTLVAASRTTDQRS